MRFFGGSVRGIHVYYYYVHAYYNIRACTLYSNNIMYIIYTRVRDVPSLAPYSYNKTIYAVYNILSGKSLSKTGFRGHESEAGL